MPTGRVVPLYAGLSFDKQDPIGRSSRGRDIRIICGFSFQSSTMGVGAGGQGVFGPNMKPLG